MKYDKKFKIRLVEHFELGYYSISQVADEYQIPKQTLARWVKLYRRFGEPGLESRKSGVKVSSINHELERMVLNMWKKRKRSIYRMRIDLKRNYGTGNHSVSERRIKKIYEKNKLQADNP